MKFTTDKVEGEAYSIYSISGQLISKGIVNSSIPVYDLSQGIYFIQIKNRVVKFIKQ